MHASIAVLLRWCGSVKWRGVRGLCGGGGGGGDGVSNQLLVWFMSTGYWSRNTVRIHPTTDVNIRRYIYLEYTTAVIIVNGLVV